MEELDYNYWEKEKLKARQADLKVLVKALYASMASRNLTEYTFSDSLLLEKYCAGDPGEIFVDKLFLREKSKGVDMQYIIADYINNNPIIRRCTIKQVVSSDIAYLADRLIKEGLIDLSVKESMTAFVDYENRYKEYINNKKKNR